MKPQTVRVGEFTVARKFCAAHFPCPVLACLQQRRGDPAVPVRFRNEDSLEVPDRRGLRSFHVVVPQLALRKTVGHAILFRQKDSATFVRKQFAEFRPHFFGRMFRPKLQSQCSDGFRVADFSFSDQEWENMLRFDGATAYTFFVPTVSSMETLQNALKEYLGYFIYHLRGWI